VITLWDERDTVWDGREVKERWKCGGSVNGSDIVWDGREIEEKWNWYCLKPKRDGFDTVWGGREMEKR
jgi:hypothetical protein